MKRTHLPVKDLATILGVTPRALNDWANQGLIQKQGRGRYDMKQAFDVAVRKTLESGMANNTDSNSDDEQLNAKLKFKRAQYALSDLKRQITKIDLIPADLLLGTIGDLMVSFRSQISQLGLSMPDIAAGRTEEELFEVLNEEVDAIFSEHLKDKLKPSSLKRKAKELIDGVY